MKKRAFATLSDVEAAYATPTKPENVDERRKRKTRKRVAVLRWNKAAGEVSQTSTVSSDGASQMTPEVNALRPPEDSCEAPTANVFKKTNDVGATEEDGDDEPVFVGQRRFSDIEVSEDIRNVDGDPFAPFTSHLSELGIKVIVVPGNGACFYFAIYGTQVVHVPEDRIEKCVVNNDGAMVVKDGILSAMLGNLDRIAPVHSVSVLYRRYFRKDPGGDGPEVYQQIKTFIKAIQQRSVGRGLDYSQWAAEHEIMATVLYLREPVFVFDVAQAGDVEIAFVTMYWLELRDRDDPTSEYVKQRSLYSLAAQRVIRTLLHYRVIPVMVQMDQNKLHYNCMRLQNSSAYTEWRVPDESGNDMHTRLSKALQALGMYAPSTESARGTAGVRHAGQGRRSCYEKEVKEEELPIPSQENNGCSSEDDIIVDPEINQRRPLRLIGKKDDKNQVPKQVVPLPAKRRTTTRMRSLEEIMEAYATPENEDQISKKKRTRNMRAALSRLKKRELKTAQAADLALAAPALRRITALDLQRAMKDLEWEMRQLRLQGRKIVRRAQLSEKLREAQRQKDRERRSKKRAEMNDEQREKLRLARKVYNQKKRKRPSSSRNIALAECDEFREADAVHGKDIGPDGRHILPEMSEVCTYCGAVDWKRGSAPDYTRCCKNGAIVGPSFEYIPEFIRALFRDPSFRRFARKYNAIFQFTSTGAHVDTKLASREGGVYTYNVHGRIFHRMGTLLPLNDDHPRAFAQVYVYDGNMVHSTDQQVRSRMAMHPAFGLNEKIVKVLTEFINEWNVYAQTFQQAGEYMTKNPSRHLRLVLHERGNTDLRTHNLPRVSEVAIIIVDDEYLDRGRDIIIRLRPEIDPNTGSLKKETVLQRISELHESYDPLAWPLIYLRGEPGLAVITSDHTIRRWFRFQLYFRRLMYNHLHMAGPLFQEICVDQYAKVLSSDLRYIRFNQLKIRADLYFGVLDRFQRDHEHSMSRQDILNSGRFTILPATVVGSPRYMMKLYQDAMAIVRVYGVPDAFVTVTCNPKWKEILRELEHGQTAEDRPDIVARVFNEKLTAIMHDLLKNECLGKVLAHMYVIEYQKRGLPHAHILLIFQKDSKPRTILDYDRLVSAEIPDKDVNPNLYDTVRRCMLHGPCGEGYEKAPCMKDGQCTKKYPKVFRETTEVDERKVLYRRPNNMRSIVDRTSVGDNTCEPAKSVGKRAFRFDNRHVVPYNPYLSSKYDCHINVEMVVREQAVKYIYKYIYKGGDRVSMSVDKYDEISQFESSMYVCAVEAAWRIFSFPLNGRSHTVVQLAVHLEGCQTVHYTDRDTVKTIETRGETTLTRFFEENRTNPEARTLLYAEFPHHYVWEERQWKERQQGGEKAIGRMVSCSPRDRERYFLRLMLCYRRGPTSFEDLRTVDGHVYESFAEAAKAAGYVEDDNHCHQSMKEAATFKMPSQLRQLFAMLLAHSTPLEPLKLWTDFLSDMADGLGDPKSAAVMLKVLLDVEESLVSCGKSLADYPMLPQIRETSKAAMASGDAPIKDNAADTWMIENERAYDPIEIEKKLRHIHQFNEDQRAVYDAVISAVDNPQSKQGKLFFLDGPGGTGKSFVLEAMLAKARQKKKIALAVATSGIAALLLTGGRTAHSRFHLSLKLHGSSTCFMTAESPSGRLMKETELIIWDEAPMQHRHAFEAVDRTLRSLMQTPDIPFGGKVVVLAGDFRQILPVISGGVPGQVVEACIKRSLLWKHFKTMRLRINMRLRGAQDAIEASELQAFSMFLLEIGEGRHKRHADLDPSYARLPDDILLGPAPQGRSMASQLIEHVYGDLRKHNLQASYFAERAILAPWNADVEDVNNKVLDMIPVTNPTDEYVYLSNDSIAESEDSENSALYPTEFLNSLSFGGLPPHKLRLKVGAIVMLMRNLQGDRGLCNGTRLQVCRLQPTLIDCVILNGRAKGNRVIIPRLELTSSDDKLPFQLARYQLPVKLAFAMTIHKSQGQTIEHLGLLLPRPVFTHGQLYVALSRVTSRARVKVAIENADFDDEDREGTYTKNIVYRNVLDS